MTGTRRTARRGPRRRSERVVAVAPPVALGRGPALMTAYAGELATAARRSRPRGMSRRRDCCKFGVAMRRMLCHCARHNQRRYRPETEGLPGPRSSVSRRSPRLRVVPRRHHEVGPVGAALRAAKPQLGQRHVAVAGQHERMQVGVRLVAARIAEHQHADVAGAQRSAVRGVGRASSRRRL